MELNLPPQTRAYYDQLFKIADADGDGVIGVNDSAFFRKSNLPNQVLGEVFILFFFHCHLLLFFIQSPFIFCICIAIEIIVLFVILLLTCVL